MMEEVLDYIRRELRYRLELADEDVQLESARVLSDTFSASGVVITVVDVRVSPYQGTGLRRPDLLELLELALLVSFRFPDYKTSIRNLSRTIRLFHEKSAYTAADTHPDNPFPAGLERLFFTLRPLEFDAMNDLWGMLGGAHFPSVVYNLRMVQTKALHSA
jgi:hypothetical protein